MVVLVGHNSVCSNICCIRSWANNVAPQRLYSLGNNSTMASKVMCRLSQQTPLRTWVFRLTVVKPLTKPIHRYVTNFNLCVPTMNLCGPHKGIPTTEWRGASGCFDCMARIPETRKQLRSRAAGSTTGNVFIRCTCVSCVYALPNQETGEDGVCVCVGPCCCHIHRGANNAALHNGYHACVPACVFDMSPDAHM